MSVPRPNLFRITCILMGLLMPVTVPAQWSVVTNQDSGAASQTRIARTTNAAGYILEIYRDSSDTIRSRLTLAGSLMRLAEKSCPTYQIDRGPPRNRSINDAPCISSPQWAEFMLGQVKDEKIESSILLSLMNGINISYRLMLADGDYRETQFSLSGSKWTMQSAFGQNVAVSGSQ